MVLRLFCLGSAVVDFLAPVRDGQPFFSEIMRNTGGSFKVSLEDIAQMELWLDKSDVRSFIGGNAANVLRVFSKLGGEADFSGRVGQDTLGAYFEAELKKSGITPCLKVAEDERTGCCIIWLRDNNEKIFCAHHRASKRLKEAVVAWRQMPLSDWLLIEGYWLESRFMVVSKAVKAAYAMGMKVALMLSCPQIVGTYKPVIYSLLPFISVLFGTEREFASLGRNSLQKVKLAVLMKGEKGIEVWRRGKSFQFPVFFSENKLCVANAANAFIGGFLYEYMKDGNMVRAVSTGEKCALSVRPEVIYNGG